MAHAENSLEAFAHALKSGCDTIECDVWHSRDKRVVVFHDGDLARMCGAEGQISEIDYAELPLLRGPHAATCRIPLLEEVLDLLVEHGSSICIEFKQEPGRGAGLPASAPDTHLCHGPPASL